jgi:DNA-binding NarL/FixJ family response regulator
LKFLLSDTNTLFSAYLSDLIKNNNDECLIVSDEDVYSSYKKHMPECVLITLKEYSNSGFKIVERLKKDYPSTIVIVISDFSDKLIRLKAEEIGADGFISKEDLSKLFEMIKIFKRKYYKQIKRNT